VPTNDARYLASVTNYQQGVTLDLASGTTVATATAGSEPATLDQVLSLLESSSTLYLSPSNCTVCPQNSVTNRTLSATPSATAWTIVYSGSVTNGAYLFSFVAPSNEVATILAGNQTANIYMTHVGSIGGSTLSCKLEGYIYNPATSNSTEYAETAASFSVAKSGSLPTTPTTPIAVIPYSTNLTGNLRYQIRVKVIAANSVTSVTMWGGSNSISSVSFPVSDSVTLGARGATGIKDSLGNAGTYDSTARTLTTPALTPAGVAAAGGVTNGQHNVALGTNVTMAGNVGIGTTAPATRLQIGNSGQQNAIRITGLNTSGMAPVLSLLRTSSAEWVMAGAGTAASDFLIGVNPSSFTDSSLVDSAKCCIRNNGNVGIGTVIPAAKLHVAGSIICSTQYLYYASATNCAGVWMDADNQYVFKIKLGVYSAITNAIP
jgi:hypothetical protein